LYAFADDNLNINEISGSTYTGNGETGDGANYFVGGCGLYAFAKFNDNVIIGTIGNSTFTGKGDVKGVTNRSVGGCGLYASARNDITINAITGSTFKGTGTVGGGDNSSPGCGLYALSYNGTNITLGTVTNCDFRDSTNVGVWLFGISAAPTITINGVTVTTAGEALNAFNEEVGNQFTSGKDVKIGPKPPELQDYL
jgi:hypothetical protein